MADTEPTPESRLSELERRLTQLQTRDEVRRDRERRIEDKVDELLEDMHQRRGRETANTRQHRDDKDARHELGEWLRAFIPTGLWVGVFTVLQWIARQLWNGPSGQ